MNDSLRTLLDSVFAAPEYRWADAPRQIGWLAERWAELVEWFERLRVTDPLLYRALLAVLVIALLVVLSHAVWVLVRTVRSATEREASARSAGVERRDAAWYRHEADRLAAEGRFVDALGVAFQALVLELDRRGVVRYDPSKTPREYARDSALPEHDRSRLSALVGALYQHAFGGRPCGPAEYRAWRQQALEGWSAFPS